MPTPPTDLPEPAQHLERVLRASDAFLYLLDRDGDGFHFAWVSQAVERLLGYTPEEARTPGWFEDGVHPEDAEELHQALRTLQEEGSAVHEFRFRHQDGRYRWLREELHKVDGGQVAGVAVDITERREAERAAREAAERTRSLLEAAPEAVILADQDGRIQEANAAAAAIFGYPPAELLGRPFTLLIPERFRTENTRLLEEVFSGELELPSRAVSMRGLRRSGEEFAAEVSVFTHSVQDEPRVSAIVRDVSERRELERERERVIRDLRAALDEVRALRDILPICAMCKSIRDDEGFWQGVEGYFRSHAAVQFSHGICPGCAEALYGELAEEDGGEEPDA